MKKIKNLHEILEREALGQRKWDFKLLTRLELMTFISAILTFHQ